MNIKPCFRKLKDSERAFGKLNWRDGTLPLGNKWVLLILKVATVKTLTFLPLLRSLASREPQALNLSRTRILTHMTHLKWGRKFPPHSPCSKEIWRNLSSIDCINQYSGCLSSWVLHLPNKFLTLLFLYMPAYSILAAIWPEFQRPDMAAWNSHLFW